jgi:hypothetical protein
VSAIGGRILDSSAILAFVAGAPYPSAVVWHAVKQNVVLAIPSAALSEAWAYARPEDYDVLEVLLGLPVVVVVDDLGAVVRPPVPLRRDPHPAAHPAAHVVRRGRERPGWAIVTGRAEALRALDPDVEVDELP